MHKWTCNFLFIIRVLIIIFSIKLNFIWPADENQVKQVNCDFSNCRKEGWKNSGLYRIQSRVSRAALVEDWIISCFFSTVAVIASHLRKLLLYFIYMLMRDLRGNFGTLFNCTECRYYLLVEWPYLADCYFNSRHKKTNNKRSLRWENVSFALKQKK